MNRVSPNHKLLLSAIVLVTGNLLAAEATVPPAKIENPVKEINLTQVVL